MTPRSGDGQYDALVFDMDGTLVEYTGYEFRRRAAVAAFDAVGIDPTEDELLRVAEDGTANAREVCADRGVAPADFYDAFDPLLADLQRDLVADGGKLPYDDALDALDRLGLHGSDTAPDGGPALRAGVLSNNYQSVVESVVRRHFSDRFGATYGVPPGIAGRDQRKPATGRLERTIGDLGADRDRVLMVGDGADDVAVAAAAGVDSVHVRRRDRSLPDEADPTYSIADLSALSDIVLGGD